MYANSLLTAVECLVQSALRPPAVASELSSGGFLERSFKMIVSETQKQSNSRWLQVCVLLCAMVVLPLHVTYAQDYKAVEKRLGEAVAEGELSLEHAAEMMEVFKEATEDEHDDDIEHRFEVWIGSVGERLKAAVEAGKLSEEDAWKKWYQFKENELAPELKANVHAGEMSEKAAWGIWHELEKAEDGERLKAAVAKGEMSKEEAWVKWRQINKEGDRDSSRITREDYRRKEAELRTLVAAGKVSAEDAERRIRRMRAAISTEEKTKTFSKEECDRAEAEIKKLVDEGKVKEEDAMNRLE